MAEEHHHEISLRQSLNPLMTTKTIRSIIYLAAFAGLCFGPTRAFVQANPADAKNDASDDSFEMVASDGQGKEKHSRSDRGFVDQVGLNANQLVPITLHFPRRLAGAPVALGALDGGQLDLPPGDLSVASDGAVRFRFRAAQAPGLYRVLVQVPGEQHCLQFYVIDPQHPRRQRTARSGN